MDKNTKETLLGIDLYKNLSREELILGLLASTAREDEMKPRKVFVEATSLKQSDSRSRRKKGAKTQPQGLREKTIWKRVST